MCRINPRVDFAFKKLFGTESNKDLLIDFINSIVDEKDKVVDLEIKNPYNPQNFRNDKLSILDIKAQDTLGKWYNIEMQIMDQDYFDKRALYYWAKLYTGQLTSGVNYSTLNKTICINILNFICLDDKDYHNIYKLKNTKTNTEYLDHMELHFIELNKYDENLITLLDRWVNFLKKADMYSKDRLPEELKEVESIKKAITILEEMYLSDEERESYEARLKWLRDEEMALLKAERKGMEIGLEKGMEKGMEKGKEEGTKEATILIAKNLLDILDNKTISDKTGLSIKEIETLRAEKL